MHAGAKPIIFKYAKSLRWPQTPQEEILWEYLRHKPLGNKFRRQHPFNRYILDFYCHRAQLCIELDGYHHLYNATQVCKDKCRSDLIASYGVTTLRFLNNEVDSDFNHVTKTIEDFLTRHK
jgi:very-short-patch-repair endonuclease